MNGRILGELSNEINLSVDESTGETLSRREKTRQEDKQIDPMPILNRCESSLSRGNEQLTHANLPDKEVWTTVHFLPVPVVPSFAPKWSQKTQNSIKTAN